MELEEMQAAYTKLSHRVEKQEILSTTLLEKMTRQGYQSKLNRIKSAEWVGTLICYAGAAYVSVHLPKVEGIMQAMAAVAVVILLLLPILSLASVRALHYVNPSETTYLDTLHTFGRQKRKFQKFQKINVFLGLLLMLLTLPVLAAIQGKDLSKVDYFWPVIFPAFVGVILGFAFWVLRSYNKALQDMESLLSDINH